MRQSIVAHCHLFSLSIKISLLPISFKYSNDWRTILFSAAHTIPFKRHGCRTPSATTLFLSIEIYYVHQFLLDIANVSFLVNKFKKIITLLKCLETRRKETYSSFYFLSFFFFYAYLIHSIYTQIYIHVHTHAKIQHLTPFGSNSLYVVYRNTKRFPLQMKNSSPPPLPFLFLFVHLDFLSFLFFFLYFLLFFLD